MGATFHFFGSAVAHHPTPDVDHQHLGTVTSLLIVSSTVYVQKPERKTKTNQPHSAISASWLSLSAAAGAAAICTSHRPQPRAFAHLPGKHFLWGCVCLHMATAPGTHLESPEDP